jgi:hypothetical protein
MKQKKKPWTKPAVREMNLPPSEIERLFPNKGANKKPGLG